MFSVENIEKHPKWEIPIIPTLRNTHKYYVSLKMKLRGFPGGAVVENPPANAGDMGSIPGPGRSHMPQSN